MTKFECALMFWLSFGTIACWLRPTMNPGASEALVFYCGLWVAALLWARWKGWMR